MLSESARRSVDEWASRFRDARPFRHVVMDNFLQRELHARLVNEFPRFDEANALNEHGVVGGKAACADVCSLGPAYEELDAYIQTAGFIRFVEAISGIPDLLFDPDYLGGGTHENRHGQGLAPHVDFNYHARTGWHRRLNLILYMNEVWDESWGGAIDLHLDPWNPSNDYKVTTLPTANRAVLFETTESSWHGFSPIHLPEDQRHLSRKSFAIYLYTRERAPAETAPPHATVYVLGQIPSGVRPNSLLTDNDYQELKRQVGGQTAYLRLMYDREKELGSEIAALKTQFREAMAHTYVPLQGYVSRTGGVAGLWPDLWMEKVMSFGIRAERPTQSLQVSLWIPGQIEDQAIDVRIDGTSAAILQPDADGKAAASVPLLLDEGEEAIIELSSTSTWSPPGDERQLAAVLSRLVVNH